MMQNKFGIAGGAVLLGLLLAATGAHAQSNQNANMPAMQAQGTKIDTQGFVSMVRRNIEMENELSKMASKNSSNDDVKALAKQVMHENRKIGMSLTGVMASTNPSAIPFPAPVSSQMRAAQKEMKKATGTQFDGMYLSAMDGYVKNDETIATEVSSGGGNQDFTNLIEEIRTTAQARQKQIAQVAESEHFKFQ